MTVEWDDPKIAAECLVALHAEWHEPPAELVEKKGQFDYLSHAHVTNALLKADPFWGWEPFSLNPDGSPRLVVVDGQPIGLWIKLTVCGHTRPGYGSLDKAGESDAVKKLISDALKNAAMRFGVALGLWAKEL